MTLMEVIVACVIFPVVIFGATSLLMGLARVSDKTNAGMDFLMKMDTVFMRLETDLLSEKPQSPYPQVVWGDGYVELQIKPFPSKLNYRYYIASRTLSKYKKNGAFGVESTEGLSVGVLLPDVPPEDHAAGGTCLASPSEANCHAKGIDYVFGVSPTLDRVDISFRSERQVEGNQHGFTKSISFES